MSAERLHPDDVAAIAAAVAEQISAIVADALEQPDGAPLPSASVPRLVDADTVARALGLSRSSVYEHAEALGARRLGDSSRPRLRFDLDEAVRAWASRSESRGSAPPEPSERPGAQTRRRRVAPTTTAQLLPIRGRES